MVNTQLSSEVRRMGQFAGAAQEIVHTMERYGDIGTISTHHAFSLEVPDEFASDTIHSLEGAITDTHQPDTSIKNFFSLRALGQPTTTMPSADAGNQGPFKIQQTAEGADIFVPIIGDVLVELQQRNGKTHPVGYTVKNYPDAMSAHHDTNTGELANNPLYQLLLRSCQATEMLPVEITVAELRDDSIKQGFSRIRQYGRLDIKGRHFITYKGEKPCLYPEDIFEEPEILRETYATTTFTKGRDKARVDTKLHVDSLLNAHEIGFTGVPARKLHLISSERTVIGLESDSDAYTEAPSNMLDALEIISPLLVAARAVTNNRHIRYDRRRAA